MRYLSRLFTGIILTFVASSFAIGCGPQKDPPVVTADTDAGTDAGTCGPDETECGGECVNLQQNRDHCGTCGNACGRADLVCVAGSCQCIKNQNTDCGNACFDLSSDPNNCGTCGNTCGSNQTCKDGTCQTKSIVKRTIEQTNRIRTMGYDCDSEGNFSATSEVEGNEELHEAAQKYAETMAEHCFFSHTYSPPDCNAQQDGCHDFAWRIGQTDYQGRPVGENIARGQDTPQRVVNGWAESDGHCANMMNPQAEEMGIGYAESDKCRGPYWVQVFGK